MTWLQSIFIAFLQGITEPFPMSSLGHAVILPAVMGWHLHLRSPEFLPFITFLHLGTLCAFGGVFWKDWKAILYGIFSFKNTEICSKAWRLLLLLALATLPAVLIGGTCEHKIRNLFASPLPVCFFLILNGFLLLFAARYATPPLRVSEQKQDELETKNILEEDLSYLTCKSALIIGLWQCLALLPGFSRSGAAMIGGLTQNLSFYAAARISLLLAEPIIFAASCKELIEIRHLPHKTDLFLQIGAGSVVAAFTAYIAASFLLSFFKKDSSFPLKFFGVYCLVVGTGSALWLFL